MNQKEDFKNFSDSDCIDVNMAVIHNMSASDHYCSNCSHFSRDASGNGWCCNKTPVSDDGWCSSWK